MQRRREEAGGRGRQRQRQRDWTPALMSHSLNVCDTQDSLQPGAEDLICISTWVARTPVLEPPLATSQGVY